MERRLAAIPAADAVGYSRLVAADEEGTIARLKAALEELIEPGIARHGGRIVKTMGDGLSAEFPSVVDAVRSAVETRRAMAKRAAAAPDDRRIVLRIGLLRSRHGFRTVPGDVRELLDLRKLVSSAVRQAGGQTVPTKCLHQRRRPHTAMGAYPALREALPGIALIQVIHVRDESAVAEAVDIASAVDGLLLDSGSDQLILIQIEGCLHHQPAIPYMRLNHIAVQEAPIAVSTTTTRSRPGWHSIGVSTPSQRPARPRPRLSRFPLVHRMIHLHRPDHTVSTLRPWNACAAEA